ncbi:citrate lyase holo-[acyl-carrier protein] synthase [Candidatus Xianfuyuplasma coldseepsis]|uniref:Citrate lyase holo-[acyl-carrier protein] synthase n=1 Tax=Candidatus Xianfuyuplasma coldseepsis TaxID=2782163 RepID=A0A7L7KNK6_9MOLU|nr:citrate lyase holo-[acyl-carrier protein] synthase [Xianfuyuplasma coldseepsis]QMS84321.1 citrate lyase holo-[acyl-carrier protein] synthase [Xianfuyuplasma coldseepsis]
MNPILQAREARHEHVQQLMRQYPDCSVVILKTNVVGTNKNPVHMRFICSFFNDLVHRTFGAKIQLHGRQESADGNYCFYVINEVGTLVKERTIELEEYNSIGRLIDLDVYYKKPISRQDLQCATRTCLLCDNFAHICSRNKTHSDDEIHQKIQEITCDFLIDYLTNITIKAIYSELELYPKFGLVSHRDNGCHLDMNYETFIRSTFALKPFISRYIEEGCNDNINPKKLQQIGQQAEAKMFQVTAGINTQKGLIFALGVFLPVLTKNIIQHNNEAQFIQDIQELSRAIVGSYYEQLTEETATSHGDYIYLEHGLKGIRGEACRGFQCIFDIPTIVHHDDDVTHHGYLLRLMAVIDDTTIVHKTSIKTLRTVQQEVQQFLDNGGYLENKESFIHLSDTYKQQCISPGGSADLLVLKIIYEQIKHLLKHD